MITVTDEAMVFGYDCDRCGDNEVTSEIKVLYKNKLAEEYLRIETNDDQLLITPIKKLPIMSKKEKVTLFKVLNDPINYQDYKINYPLLVVECKSLSNYAYRGTFKKNHYVSIFIYYGTNDSNASIDRQMIKLNIKNPHIFKSWLNAQSESHLKVVRERNIAREIRRYGIKLFTEKIANMTRAENHDDYLGLFSDVKKVTNPKEGEATILKIADELGVKLKSNEGRTAYQRLFGKHGYFWQTFKIARIHPLTKNDYEAFKEEIKNKPLFYEALVKLIKDS